jgi:hypothetical protein
VSYGYALAMALAGGRVLALGAPLHPAAKAQAALLLAYGLRLGGFLLYRERTLERFQAMVKRIDQKVGLEASPQKVTRRGNCVATLKTATAQTTKRRTAPK